MSGLYKPGRRAADLTIGELRPEHSEAAVRLLSGRFLDDPVWLAIGPSRREHLRRVLNGFHRAELASAQRYGGVIFTVTVGGILKGVQVAYGAGSYPLPRRDLLNSVPAMLLAGPGPALRAFRVMLALERIHPHEPHVYARLLAADPSLPGCGRMLVKRLIEYAHAQGAPIYGETMRSENVRFMESLGFTLRAESTLLESTPLWSFRLSGHMSSR
jgi:GNAT superfamily N-acetyltransferase